MKRFLVCIQPYIPRRVRNIPLLTRNIRALHADEAVETESQEQIMERLKGKNILITGASSGIGQAIAVRFAREGANIAINYRSGAGQAEVTRAMARAARSNGTGRELVVQA